MIFSLAITGPTASGKTALSLGVAEALGCEIISLDSMQIYSGMDIGTAKATELERKRVPHHLLSFLSPSEQYSTEKYREDALNCAQKITSRGKIPLFVGGTGLYLDTLLRSAQDSVPESDTEYRDKIMAELKTDADRHALWQRLLAVDPESAEKIHENNLRRVIRALEIYDKTGKPKSLLDRESRLAAGDIKIGMITLDFHNRDTLYNRVDLRVDQMIAEGLVAEVESLYTAGLLKDGTTAAQAIGYKEIISHLKGEVTLAEAVELIKLSTRRYAKRQLTWFRHNEGAYRLFADDENGKIKTAEALINEALAVAKDMIENESK